MYFSTYISLYLWRFGMWCRLQEIDLLFISSQNKLSDQEVRNERLAVQLQQR